MTRIAKSKKKSAKSRRRARDRRPGRWLLQDAKARFSELVRRVRTEGPQHVTVHGRDEVVVVAAEEFRRLEGDPSGAASITHATAQHMLVRGLIERDRAATCYALTDQGRAALAALLAQRWRDG